MRNARALTLKRETLSDLSAGELSAVNGGSHLCTVTHGPSFDQACPTPTLPINQCLSLPSCEYELTLNC